VDRLSALGLIFLIGFGGAALSTPLAMRLGERWGLVDRPGGRRRHPRPVSRLGGLGLAVGFFLAWFASLTLVRFPGLQTHDPRWIGLMIGALFVMAVGVADDALDLSPRAQYAGYLAAALIALAFGIRLDSFNNPLNNQYVYLPLALAIPLTVLWVTGMIVTVNWLDGLDGLATSVSSILTAVLTVHVLRTAYPSIAPVNTALLGAGAGFLVFNLPPARVFLGSNGAFLIGYLLAGLGILAGGRVATVLLVMGIPILDTAWTIGERLREHQDARRGDRRHLHYRLLDSGLSNRQILALYVGFGVIFGAINLLISPRLLKLALLTALVTGTFGLLRWLSSRKALPHAQEARDA